MTQRGALLSTARARRFSTFLRGGIAGVGAASIAAGVALGASHGGGVATHQASPAKPMRLAAAAPQSQYWMVASDGGIFSFGGAPFYGSTGNIRLAKPIVGMAATPDGGGYWFVASDGGIFTEGDAGFFGSHGGSPLNQPIVGMAATPDGGGYWLVARDGGIFTYGDAGYFGSTGAIHLNQPIVGMASTPDGLGYWLVAADGGIFTFGDAGYYGSTGAIRLNQPIVGMAASPSGLGYWLVARDGGIFSFGDAQFFGSTGAIHLNQPIVGMAATQTGQGYWFVASDGGIFSFGDAVFSGSMGGTRLAQPVVGMAGRPVLFPGSLSLSLTSPTVTADGVSTVQITATVTDPGTAVPGDTLVFGVLTQGCGTLSNNSGVTNLAGQVTTTYTSSPGVMHCQIGAAEVFGNLVTYSSINQVAGAPAYLNATPSGDASYTADAGNTGIPATFTLTDSFGHAISGTQVNFSTNLPSTCTVVPTSGSTDSNGSATVAVHDTTAADSCVVTGSVPGTSAMGSTGHFNITPGAVGALSVSNPSSPQIAGTGYDVTVTAHDHYSNLTNPAESAIVFGGSAVTTSSPNGNPATEHWKSASFSSGQAVVTVTSYAAISNAIFTVSATGSTPGSTSAFTINPAPASTVSASPMGDMSLTADQMNSSGIQVTFTVADTYGNLVPNQPLTLTSTPTAGFQNATGIPASPASTGSSGPTLGVVTFLLKDTVDTDGGTLTAAFPSPSTVSAKTGKITITAGQFAALVVGAPSGTVTAGTAYQLPVTAQDGFHNTVQPASTTGFSFTGPALDPSPSGRTPSQPTFTGPFGTNGQTQVSVTSYNAETASLTVTYANSPGTPFSGASPNYTVNPNNPTTMTATGPLVFSGKIIGNAATYAEVVTQTGTASTAAQRTVSVQVTDTYLNPVQSFNASTLTGTLTAESSDPDSGGISGATPPSDFTVVSTPVAFTSSMMKGAASFIYTAPSTFPASGAGTVAVSATSTGASPTTVNFTMVAVATKVQSLVAGVPSCVSNCAAGTTQSSTYTALDYQGLPVGGASLDTGLSGFDSHATRSPTATSQTSTTAGPTLGTLAVSVTETSAPTVGSIIGALHDAPIGDANDYVFSASINFVPAAMHSLVISTSATDPTKTTLPAETAGTPYTFYVFSLDTFGNPTNPPGGANVAVSGTAATDVSPAPSSTPSVHTLHSFVNGAAQLDVTSYKADAPSTMSALTVTCTSATICPQTSTLTINPASAFAVNPTTLTPSAANNSYSADISKNGITVGFNVVDQYDNTIPSVTLNFGKTGLTHAAALNPTSAVTNNSGNASVVLTDSLLDSGTVTATVNSTTVTNNTQTITIVAGKVTSLSFVSPPSTEPVGSAYTLTISAVDGETNPAGPAWGSLTFSGPAFTDVSPGPFSNADTLTENSTGLSSTTGQGTVSLTSYRAEAAGNLLTVTCTDASECSGTPSVSANYSITPGAARWVIARDGSGTFIGGVTATSAGQIVTMHVDIEDAYGNPAATQTGIITVSLQGTTGSSDGGSLSGGGTSTAADTNTTVQVQLDLSNSNSRSFSYLAPNPLPGSPGTGTITLNDTSSTSISPKPTSIPVSD